MRRRRHYEHGVSILEMMVVLGIMALVIGVVAPRALDYFGRAKSQTAEIQMQQIKGALQLLYVDAGRFPTDAEGLGALMADPDTMPRWRGPYMSEPDALKDPWGRDYIYRLSSGSNAFELSTLGRDGQPGGSGEDADISL